MCDYISRQMRCGHLQYIVHRWCSVYQRTHKKCRPNVVFWESWQDRTCGACMPQTPLIPALERMIKRPQVPVSW